MSLRIAIAKGRPLEEIVALLHGAGIHFDEDPQTSRQLTIPSRDGSLEIIVVRGADVPVYLQYGTVDLAVVGADILVESDMQNIFELLDLQLARCRMIVAGPQGSTLEPYRLYRVATKYPVYSRSWFYRRSMFIEPIKLHGSVELAPVAGLADLIVDLTSTGQTLAANGLEVLDCLLDVSARLMVNRAIYKIKSKQIDLFADTLRRQLRSGD